MLYWFIVVILILFIVAGIWYIRELLSRFRFLSENSYILSNKIETYKEHLEAVYGLPMFYGDETLKFLLEHTKAVVSLLQEEYSDITSITESLEETFEEEEKIEETEEEIKQDVFYGGTRTSDP